ncbi:MAG TPA: MBL fold metallo-hydrolase [Acidobacteriaceae bacterium]
MGVPSLACSCAVCTSADPRDKRLRPSILLRWPAAPGHEPETPSDRTVLIDTGPDFRTQALRANLQRVDAVFYTHSHADHILGMDDLRPLSFATHRESGPIPLYVTPETRTVLERIYAYTFSPASKYPNRARVVLEDVHNGSAVVDNLRFIPVPVLHGELPITGYRFGNTAYLTDVSVIPETSFKLLEGLETLIVSALRHVPHPSHATVRQAVAWAERIGARNTWFTHISHDLGHEETNAMLPSGMALAYDGLTIPFKAPITTPGPEEAQP